MKKIKMTNNSKIGSGIKKNLTDKSMDEIADKLRQSWMEMVRDNYKPISNH